MDKWWVPGLSIGYEHSFVHQIADFLKALEEGKPCPPTFREAQETQKVCQAVLESARSKSWKDTGVEWK
jgi:predicted dehydrogenase